MTTSSSSSNSGKGFWDLSNFRLDSIAGKVILAGGVGYALYFVLPILNTIIWNAVSIAVGCAILGAFALALIDGRLIRLADYVFRLGVRFLVGFFITLDPIGIMKNYLQDVVKTVREFGEQIGNLRGAIDKTKEDLSEFKTEYDSSMAYVAAAKRRNETDDPSVETEAAKAERRHMSIEEINKLLDQMQASLSLLERYYRKSVAYRDDLKDNISFTERKRKTLQIASSAFRKAASILRGDSIGAEFYDQAAEAAKEQAAGMVGEMKQWVFESQDMIRVFEGKSAANVELALQRLEQQEQSGQSLLLEYQPGQTIDLTAPAVTSKQPATTGSEDISRFLKS